MKILVLSFFYQPDLSAGSFRTTTLVEILKQNPDVKAVDVLTTMPNRYHDFAMQAAAFEQKDKVSVQRIAIPEHKNGLLDQVLCFKTFALAVLQQTKNQNYDVVYATSSKLMTAWLGVLVGKQTHAKIYLDIRDIFADTVKDVFSGWKGKVLFPILSLLESWTIKRANKVNLVSEGFKPYFEGRYPNQNFSFFTNGIDDEFLQVSSSNPLLEKKSPPYQVLYAGNIGEGQGLHSVIAPLARAMQGEVEFVIIGSGGRLQQLKDTVAGLNNVHLLPPVNRAELLDYYAHSDVLFLHLNDYEAFLKVLPSKLFEYGALGKPIWAGVSGYAAQFIQQEIDNAVVFKPCDVAMAQQVFSLLDIQDGNRKEFKEKFARSVIMGRMSQDVTNL